MSRAKRALIIGGGVAGPVAAMALRQAEIDSVVYEAYEGGADDIGAFLTFASNGLDALRTIDANDLVLAEGFPTPRMKIQSGSGKHLGDVPLGGTLPDGTVSQTLKRADLYRALRDEAVRRGARVEYGKRLVDAETTPDGLVARFEDGTEAEGDLLIGADGVHSRTRRLIDPSAPGARYVPVLNIGGYARGVSVPAEPGQFRMVFGKRAFFGYAVHPSGDVWWFSNPPRADEPTGAELAAIGTEQWREMLLDLFAEDATPAVEIIRSTPENSPVGPLTIFPPSRPGTGDRWLSSGTRRTPPPLPRDRAHPWLSRTPSCSPRACATCLMSGRLSLPTSGCAAPAWSVSSPTGRGRATARPPDPSPGFCAT